MIIYTLTGLIFVCLANNIQGTYINDTNDVATCESCHVTNRYGCVTHNECCFYFAEKSSCSGCCKFEMELDPHSFAPKEVSQSCCTPVAKRYKKTVLWCKGKADIPTKKVDAGFPGWYYEEGFQYTVATQCDCVVSDWQNDVTYDSPYVTNAPDVYKPEETEQPEDQFLKSCMLEISKEGCFIPYPGQTGEVGEAVVSPGAHTVDECIKACLYDSECWAFDFYDPDTCELYNDSDPPVPYVLLQARPSVTHYKRLLDKCPLPKPTGETVPP